MWEGRYNACPVDSGSYFLACSRYIELNPVRAWMVASPGEYPWSSSGGQVGERADPLLITHPEYLALGTDAATRAAAYRALFANALPTALLAEIRVYLPQQKAWERIDSAPESRPERGASPRPARWAGRRERRIVPDTFLGCAKAEAATFCRSGIPPR